MKKALAGVLLLLSSGCSGGSAAQETSTTSSSAVTTAAAPATTATSVPTTIPATTTSTTVVETTVPFVFPEPAAEKLAVVQVSASDFGDDYVGSETPDDTEQLCEGVERLAVALPAEASDERQFDGPHFFFSNVSVYPSIEKAEEALDYLSDAYQRCNGGTRVAEGETIQLSASAFSPGAILGSDRNVGLLLEQTTPALSLLVTAHLVTADRMLFFVGGTDRAVVEEMSDVLVSRTRLPAEPVRFAPTGTANIGPGYTDPRYYSFAEGPDQLRALPLSEGALRWLNESPFERVDEMASESCVLTQTMSVGDSTEAINAVLFQAFTEEDQASYDAQELGEVYGAANAIYCPMLSEFLLEVIDAVP